MHIGQRVRLRLRRTLLGLTQEALAERLGLTFQQVQKYELGANRVGASRLFDLSRVLDIPVAFFFDDMAEEVKGLSPAHIIKGTARAETADAVPVNDPHMKRETLELVRAYYSIPNEKVRRQVYELAKSLGAPKAGSAS